ncbi:hypothetical protein [Devosia submarina]|uniref:hypothetical protein n=1 Tax=Devosia submarina TaxID=1173082 RepID=UPI000D378F3F|nr:hypothetical protein [Devosia submarina]
MNMMISPSLTAGCRTEEENAGELMQRIRLAVSQAATDYVCKTQVDEAVQRFISFEHSRLARWRVMKAQRHLKNIVALTEMLSELEEVSWTEIDRSVFGELAHLFEDVAQSASLGSLALRLVSQDAQAT